MSYATQSVITHGTAASAGSLDDLTGFYVTKLSISSSRDRSDTTNSDGTITSASYSNPTVTFAYEGTYDSLSDTGIASFANYHPGVAVTADANLRNIGSRNTNGFRGFDSNFSDGVLIYEDPSDTYESGEDTALTFNLVHLPNIV